MDHPREPSARSEPAFLEEAPSEGRADARTALRRAIADVEEHAAPCRVRDRETLQEVWRGLVSGEWRLIEHFDAHGKKYVVATVSRDVPPERPASMSAREHEVMRRAAKGDTNKEIAADLGVAQSTVRVLLHRAAQKLGTSNRDEAIRRFVTLSEPPPPMLHSAPPSEETPSRT